MIKYMICIYQETAEEKLNKAKKKPDHTPDGWHKDICQGIIMAYFIVMTVIYPFYAPGGYLRIGEVKYEFFRNVSLVTLAVLAGTILLSVLIRRDWKWILRNYRRMSVTDWFAYGYFVAVLLSYLYSPYKEDALWGAEGWYMGAITQIIFVLLYFSLSRYFHCSLGWVGIWLLAASVVFLLGICNSYSIYPIAMEGQEEGFISTLGNINWFCGYWSVTAPIGMALYWCGEHRWIRLLAGIYSVIAMVAGMAQGSSSAYLVFMVMLIALFLLSLRDNRRWYHFLELCMLFALSCQIARCMLYLPGFTYHYQYYGADGQAGTMAFLWNSRVSVWLFLGAAVCCLLFRVLGRRGMFHIEKHRWLWAVMAVAVSAIICFMVFLMLVDNGVLYFREVPFTVEQDSYLELVFDEDWGNGRGATWNCGMEAYRGMDALHKIVGIGPDCFADYVYDVPDLARKLGERFVNLRLTNAHNEQITLLVNVGALGWICFMGIFISAFVRYIKRAGRQPILYLCALGILAYGVHNLVSFQQVLNTPCVFMVLGIGERYSRGVLGLSRQ